MNSPEILQHGVIQDVRAEPQPCVPEYRDDVPHVMVHQPSGRSLPHLSLLSLLKFIRHSLILCYQGVSWFYGNTLAHIPFPPSKVVRSGVWYSLYNAHRSHLAEKFRKCARYRLALGYTACT